MAEELRLFGVHEELQRRLKHYLTSKTIDDLFERVLKRVEQDSGKQAVQLAMQAIWASRGGLTEKEILAIVGLKPATWAPIRNALDECLLEASGKITFAHDYMRIAVKDRYLKTKLLQKQAHINLAKYFQKQIADARRAEEEPWQWKEAGEWERLKGCLVDKDIFYQMQTTQSNIQLMQYWESYEIATNKLLENQYLTAWKKWCRNSSPETLIPISIKLAKLIRMSSRYVVALKILKTLLPICEKTFGEIHENTQEILTLTGVTLVGLGKFERSLEFQYQVLDIRRKKYGTKNIKTAETMNYIGVNLYNSGKYMESYELSKIVHEIRKRSGIENDDLAEIINNLANLENELGNYESSYEYHSQALMIRRRLHGENSWQVGNSYNNLGSLKERIGRHDQAIQYFLKALDRYEYSVGAKGADYIKTLSNLGLAYALSGDQFDKGRSCQLKALTLAREVFNSSHIEIGRILVNLAFATNSLNLKKQYLTEALSILKKLPAANSYLIGCLINLGSTCDDLDEVDAAEDYLKDAVRISEEITSKNHRLRADAIATLGYFYIQNNDRGQDGIPVLMKAVKIYQEALGELNPYLLSPLKAIGTEFFENHEYSKAKFYYQWILKVSEENFDKDSLHTAEALNNMGAILSKQNKNKLAEKFYMKALKIREIKLKEDDAALGITIFNLAALYCVLKRYPESEALFKRAIFIFKVSAPEYLSMAEMRVQELYESWGKPKEVV